MEPSLYRISAVLAGQSALVTVVGRDVAGRELQLELPPERAHALQAGQLLLLSWSAHAVPELEPALMTRPADAEPVEVLTSTPVGTPSVEPASPRACPCDEDEVFRMLGLG